MARATAKRTILQQRNPSKIKLYNGVGICLAFVDSGGRFPSFCFRDDWRFMTKKVFSDLKPHCYEHPADRQAFASLEKMPGVRLLFQKINEYGIDRLLRMQCHGSDIRVSDRNFPQLYGPFVEACEILSVTPQPELYLYQGAGHIRTWTIGVERPVVQINVDGLERLNEAELGFIFGHELARIKSSHLLYHQTAAVLPVIGTLLSNTTLGLGGLATSGMQIALLNWVMMAKFTADRAGLLACQEVEVALRTLIKLAGLPEKYINAGVIADFIAQAREFETQNFNSLDKVTRTLSYLDQLFAWAIMRASELLKWIDSGEYAALIQSPQPTPDGGAPEATKDWDFLGDW